MQAIGLKRAPQGFRAGKNMLLTEKLVQRTRAHPIGQGLGVDALRRGLGIDPGHHSLIKSIPLGG